VCKQIEKRDYMQPNVAAGAVLPMAQRCYRNAALEVGATQFASAHPIYTRCTLVLPHSLPV
jgi:hypothetical protein